MAAPTREQVRRGRLNVRQLVLEAEAMLEHSTPEHVVAEMLTAAARIAQEAGMDAEDYIRCFGNVLSTATRRDLSVSVEFGGGDDREGQ